MNNDRIYDSIISYTSSSEGMTEYQNEVTRTMDQFNKYFKMMKEHGRDWADINRTYLMYPEKYGDKYVALFRVPGATRGNIVMKEVSPRIWEILEFKFIDSTCFSAGLGCYESNVVAAVHQFIGAKIQFPEVDAPKMD